MGGGVNRSNKENTLDLQLFSSVSNPYTFTLDGNYTVNATIESSYEYDGIYGPIPDPETGLVDLSNYAEKYIENYISVTSIPTENQAYLDSGIKVSSLESAFYDMRNLTGELDLSGIDVEFCTSLKNLLAVDINKNETSNTITKIKGIEKWKTGNVIDASNMLGTFEGGSADYYGALGCSKLTEFDVSNWDTSKITNMDFMFGGCESLTNIDVSNWDTSNVTTMSAMFSCCRNLTNLDVSNWDTGNVTNMSKMFQYCEKLNIIGINNLNTSKVTTMDSMFQGFGELDSSIILDISKFDCSSLREQENSAMFSYCFIEKVILPNFKSVIYTDYIAIFHTCDIKIIDMSNWDTSQITDMHSLFYSCNNLNNIIGEIDMSSCIKCDDMFGTVNTLLAPVHLKNVPRILDLSNVGGTEGETYIIDNYID